MTGRHPDTPAALSPVGLDRVAAKSPNFGVSR